MIQEKIEKAKVLLESLPYIKEFYGQPVVIKLGGSVLVDPDMAEKFATDIVMAKYVGMKPIIVHGGGKEISRWLKKIGKESEFIDGLRVTDEATMEMTEMVLSGKIRNQLVSLINKAGGKAVGVSGKDAQLFFAKKIKSKQQIDLGYVGEVSQVNIDLVTTLIDRDYIPVVSSVASDGSGTSLNVNADQAASKVAASANALKLIYLTDVLGIKIEGKHIQSLELSEAKNLLKHPEIKGGMLPKLNYSIEALENGVEQVHIINGSLDHSVLLEMFTDKGIGTMIKAS